MNVNNSVNATIRLIEDLSLPITKESIEEEFSIHPEYLNFVGISDVLQKWRIQSKAFKIPFADIETIPLPFIAQVISKEGPGFCTVKKFTADYIVIGNKESKALRLPRKEFENQYTGSILAVEPEEDAGESNFKKIKFEILSKKIFKLFVFLISLIILGLWLYELNKTNTLNWAFGLLLILKILGLATTILLLIHSFNSNNSFTKQFCTEENDRQCNAILNSNAAKITNTLSWAEVGFFYYSATLLIAILNPSSIGIFQLLSILSIICIPYTFFSIFYQWKIAKQWCIMCCTIQTLFFLELITVYHYIQLPFEWLSNYQIILLLISILLPISSWYFFKPFFQKSIKAISLQAQLRSFKYNKQLFQKLLFEERKYTLPDKNDCLILGNKTSEKIITIISNPFCPQCAKVHEAVNSLLVYKKDIQVRIIFSATSQNDPKAETIIHFISLYQYLSTDKFKIALDEWYSGKMRFDFERWSKKYPAPDPNSFVMSVFNSQTLWIKNAKLKQTPLIIINEYEMPQLYKLNEISYLI